MLWTSTPTPSMDYLRTNSPHQSRKINDHPTQGMKLHRNIAEAVITTLHAILLNDQHAESTIKKTLSQNTKWGARDRRAIARICYDIIRWRLLMSRGNATHSNDLWGLLGTWCVWKEVALPKWNEFNSTDTDVISAKLKQTCPVYIKESIPEWLDKQGYKELGSRWHEELHALNKRASITLRVNTLKGNTNNVKKKLADEGIVTCVMEKHPHALMLKANQPLLHSKTFKKGYFEIQDVASQQVAPFLKPAPNMCVIDACAGAGGKTLHLAGLMENKGKIIALDVAEHRLKKLKERVQRAGVSIVEPMLISSPKSIEKLKNTADRLLLDVPCSGLGTLKRHPEIKWKLSPGRIAETRVLQKEILEQYADTLKPGGMLVYATCSILPSENERQIDHFLKLKKGAFKFVRQENSWPSYGFDGFYMALLKKI